MWEDVGRGQTLSKHLDLKGKHKLFDQAVFVESSM